MTRCIHTAACAAQNVRYLVAALLGATPIIAAASHAPDRTATIFVPGFDPQGPSRTGVFGADETEPLLDQAAALVGLPTSSQPDGLLRPNVVTTTHYYGDTPPAYYDATDLADLATVTAAWGGGVPRHALVVAKYARHVLERSGADQVNFLSASFGSMVVRWLIEKDVEHLASEGRIARWLSVEGVLAGNWAASQDDLVGLVELVESPTVDVEHMRYAWIEQNLHSPRRQADSGWYAGILLGQVGSTEDRLYDRALTTAMLLRGGYQPNDGVQGLWDSRFDDVTSRAWFLGRLPTWSTFHDTHYGIESNPAAWAQAVIFLTQSRRVTVTLRRATVHDVHEPSSPFLDLRPGEVVFESRVRSPAVAARWGITGAITALELEGVAPPLHRFADNGSTLEVGQIVFDDFVLAEESALDLELWAEEIDLELRYGVAETIFEPYFQYLGGGSLQVSTLQSGTYAFAAGDWSCEFEVEVFDYPFPAPSGAGEWPEVGPVASLWLWPNPFESSLRIALPEARSVAIGSQATLRVFDARGKLVRSLAAPVQSGFVWDGRDAGGREVPAGMYYHRVETPAASYTGSSLRVR